MGTLGQYLRGAREARGIDLREAAQHTRIGITYLKALEAEDFSRLPGEVFVKGFLKNYGKYLHLDEAEVMKKYEELRPQRAVAGVAADKEPAAAGREQKPPQRSIVEPVIWGAGITIALILFLLTALPERPVNDSHQPAAPLTSGQTATVTGPATQPEKLYLEVVALENTWILVRTDDSPQKKALLKKGESLIWSAAERFLLSYGSAGALKLILNGRELAVTESKNTLVRDLVVIASGLDIKKLLSEQPRRPKRKPVSTATPSPLAGTPAQEQQRPPEAAPVQEQQVPFDSAPASREQQDAPVPVPSPAAPAPQAQPDQQSPKPQ